MAQTQGEQVLLALDRGHYSPSPRWARRVWALCDGSTTLAPVVDAICLEFEVAPEVVKIDVAELLNELLDEGLLVVAG